MVITAGQVESLMKKHAPRVPSSSASMCRSDSTAGRLMAVEAQVVVADPPGPVGLPRKHHRRSVACRRVLAPPAVEQVHELRAQFRQFSL